MSLAKVDYFSAICGLFRWCLLQLRERVRCTRFYQYPAFLLLPHPELVSVCLELNKNLQELPRARVVDDSTDDGRRAEWAMARCTLGQCGEKTKNKIKILYLCWR